MTDTTQKDIAEMAMALKSENAPTQQHLEHQEKTAGEGPISDRSREEPVMGALDAEGHRPVLERSRKVR
ncbi:hypothetical protein [Porphyrobacter sp. YT40]|uniref:hypothetical protein n=1 Tax=Porphyrobacter sp. YT40 TaxID=2547601 RepID=UPI00114261C4|nr:hypothetical protein [Porphyrobacter sp. YT40]QDH35457.1 hypothetical protein E2E27_14720 [Porphyrobacter sp. YT40]